MSGKLQISFAPDMPAATVEVVSPDLETVDRLWLVAGQSKGVEVPSEASFLRIHFASGRVVTLQDPGNLHRTISLANIRTQEMPRGRKGVAWAEPRLGGDISSSDKTFGSPEDLGAELVKKKAHLDELEGAIRVTLEPSDDARRFHPGKFSAANRKVEFSPPISEAPYQLRLQAVSREIVVRLPGDVNRVAVSSDEWAKGRRLVTIRVGTSSQAADAIGGYLARGDLNSAEAMTEWADEAEALLFQKMRNPFAAALGGYLLLRLRRFDRLRSWSKNLADWFPNLSDGSIIYASQCTHQRVNKGDFREYMGKALDGTLPVFTEGLKLLRDGVRLLDKPQEALRRLNAASGIVVWSSPFTTTSSQRSDSGESIDVDVGYSIQRLDLGKQ